MLMDYLWNLVKFKRNQHSDLMVAETKSQEDHRIRQFGIIDHFHTAAIFL